MRSPNPTACGVAELCVHGGKITVEAALWLAGRGLPDWLADLREANPAGRALAVAALLVSAGAAFISLLLLVG